MNNKKEVWKDVPNYEGLYQVSNLGCVKTLSREIPFNNRITGCRMFRTSKERILKQGTTKGYKLVVLCIDKKHISYRVHQLVAMAFLNHVPNNRKIVVDHINNIKSDNRLENLQVITNRENCSKDNSNKSSKYTGVSKIGKKWYSLITINGETKYLGKSETEYNAHLVYQDAVKSIKI